MSEQLIFFGYCFIALCFLFLNFCLILNLKWGLDLVLNSYGGLGYSVSIFVGLF